MDRRDRVLGVVVVLGLAVATGCLAVEEIEGGSDLVGSTATSAAPSSGTQAGVGHPAAARTASSCDGDEERPDFDLPNGTLPSAAGGFSLAADPESVSGGDRVTFALTNVAGDRRHTGTAKMYAIQRRVRGDWVTVTRFRANRSGFNATAIVHGPGTGFSWTFPASAAGFSRDKFLICNELLPGEYRFVFAGSDPPLAVRFEIGSRT